MDFLKLFWSSISFNTNPIFNCVVSRLHIFVNSKETAQV